MNYHFCRKWKTNFFCRLQAI